MSVYTITVRLTPEEDAALRARARRAGSTAEELLGTELRGQADRSPLAGPRPDTGGEGARERNARLVALLDSFEEGDAVAQAREYADLKAGLEAARPGQRRLFGAGHNP